MKSRKCLYSDEGDEFDILPFINSCLKNIMS